MRVRDIFSENVHYNIDNNADDYALLLVASSYKGMPQKPFFDNCVTDNALHNNPNKLSDRTYRERWY